MTLDQALQALGLTRRDLDEACAAVVDGEKLWARRTAAVHALIRKHQRQLMAKLHPDVCREPGAEARAAQINQIATELLKLKVAPPVPPPVRVVIWRTGWSSTSSTTSYTTTVFTRWG